MSRLPKQPSTKTGEAQSAPSIQSDKSEEMHQQQLLGQPANESALVDEVPLIIIFRKDNISAADVSANDKQAILLRNQQVEGLSPPNQFISRNELIRSIVLDS